MDVKNSFLNGFIKEEMYVRQPPGFEDHTLPDHVFKLKKTPYELWRRRPNISYFHPFGSECLILNTKDQLAKFDSKVDKRIFLGFYDTSKAFKVFNTRTLVVEKFIHVKFNDGLMSNRKLSDLEDDFANMKIGSYVSPKEKEIKQSKEILPQIKESSFEESCIYFASHKAIS